MKAIFDKIFSNDFTVWIVVLVILVLGSLTPKTGEMVLLDEFFDCILWIILIIYGCYRILRHGNLKILKKKSGRYLVVSVCVFICIWIMRGISMDMIYGPQEIRLNNISVSKYQGHYGAISVHYYVMGKDVNGDNQRLEISYDDYARLSNGKNITVKYYSNTERVVHIR